MKPLKSRVKGQFRDIPLPLYVSEAVDKRIVGHGTTDGGYLFRGRRHKHVTRRTYNEDFERTAGAMRRERGPQASGRTQVPGVAVAATMRPWHPIITGYSEGSKSFRNLLTAGAGRPTLAPSNWACTGRTWSAGSMRR